MKTGLEAALEIAYTAALRAGLSSLSAGMATLRARWLSNSPQSWLSNSPQSWLCNSQSLALGAGLAVIGAG